MGRLDYVWSVGTIVYAAGHTERALALAAVYEKVEDACCSRCSSQFHENFLAFLRRNVILNLSEIS